MRAGLPYIYGSMSDRTPEISASSIVLLGSFNPKIFQPEWFARQGLLSQAQIETVEIKIIAPQVCQFQTEQIELAVTTDKFQLFSKPSASAAPLRDLVLGTFFIGLATSLRLRMVGLAFSRAVRVCWGCRSMLPKIQSLVGSTRSGWNHRDR